MTQSTELSRLDSLQTLQQKLLVCESEITLSESRRPVIATLNNLDGKAAEIREYLEYFNRKLARWQAAHNPHLATRNELNEKIASYQAPRLITVVKPLGFFASLLERIGSIFSRVKALVFPR